MTSTTGLYSLPSMAYFTTTCLPRINPSWFWPLGSGILLSLSFPSHPEHPLAWLYSGAWAWVGIVPLLCALSLERKKTTFSVAFRRGWECGATFSLLCLYWVGYTQGGGPAVVGGAGLMAAYLGLFTGLFAGICQHALRRWGVAALAIAPFVWTAMEYLLSLGELAFPWLLLGHSQAEFPLFVQYAEFTGAYGVSCWVVAVNAGITFVTLCPDSQRRRAIGVTLGSFALPVLYGLAVVDHDRRADLRIGLIQNNIGLEKWRPGGLRASLSSLDSLSRHAHTLEKELDLVVWPETAVPCNVGHRPDCRVPIQQLSDNLGTAILTGAPDTRLSSGEPLNSAYLFRPEEPLLPSYAKMHLVPFGERTPFRDYLPDIDWKVLTGNLGPAEFARGQERTLFRVPGTGADFAVLICFESIFPDFVRRSVHKGAHLLVNITNDSWFGDTAGPFQHAHLAVLRAVENRIAIARCATSGVSLFIDAYGRTYNETELSTVAVRTGFLQRRDSTTFYTRVGNLFAQFCTLSAVVVIVLLRFQPSPDHHR
ncbi:MAG: apolipoprotein N-acyltransferase [Candidatus Latescibacterota bacterium]|nr:apolipoprotein N-acyltransferase [Candidatus Latescibacterota bacterium]